MAGSRGLDIIARFRSVTTDFNTRQVEKELDDADRAFDKSGKAAKDWSRKVDRATQDVEKDLRDVKGEAKEAGKEVGAEFAQNVGEGLSSGNIGSLAQDTAGGLVSAFSGLGGPIGLALAPVAAVAAGVFANITAAAEQARDLAASALDELDNKLEGVGKRRAALEGLFGDAITGAGKVNEAVERLGLNQQKVNGWITDGNMTMEERRALEQRVVDIKARALQATGAEREALGAAAYSAQLLLDKTKQRETALGKAQQFASQEEDYAARMAGYAGPMADAAERSAAAREREATAMREAAGGMKDFAYWSKRVQGYVTPTAPRVP